MPRSSRKKQQNSVFVVKSYSTSRYITSEVESDILFELDIWPKFLRELEACQILTTSCFLFQ